MKFQEIDLTYEPILDGRIPVEIEVIFKYSFEEGNLYDRFQKISGANYVVFAPYVDYWNFEEAWKNDLVFGENGKPIEHMIPYYDSYAKGFLDGYFEFENEIKEVNQIFNQTSYPIETIFKEIRVGARPFSARGYFYKSDDPTEKPIPILKKELLYSGGLRVGRNYKAWFYIIKNPKPFVPIFRDFYFQWFKIYEDEFKKRNSHDPNFSSELQTVIDEIKALSRFPIENPIIKNKPDLSIEPETPIRLIFEPKIIELLFEGLKPYFNEKEKDLRDLLEGKEINKRLVWSLNQNQFTDIFYRLKNKKYISQNYTKITKWICENFVLMHGAEFNSVSVYDSIRGHTKTAKANRILNNQFD